LVHRLEVGPEDERRTVDEKDVIAGGNGTGGGHRNSGSADETGEEQIESSRRDGYGWTREVARYYVQDEIGIVA
jgi:hypothetical protein